MLAVSKFFRLLVCRRVGKHRRTDLNDTASLQPIFQALGIQLAFAAAIFSIGLLLSAKGGSAGKRMPKPQNDLRALCLNA